MNFSLIDRPLAGVDGCKGGWIAAVARPGEGPFAKVFSRFADLLGFLGPDALLAVDMPIGLPDRIGEEGRGPEALVRRLIGPRRSSVFPIPSRSAVYAESGPFENQAERLAAHTRASSVSAETSVRARKISIQAFGLFPKIREIDALLRADRNLAGRVIESHPEAAFCRLNGMNPLREAKKRGGRVNPAGMCERRRLLAAAELPPALLAARCPGAGKDDLLDAAVLLLTALRHARGEATSFPDPPGRDGFGLPVAIWI